MMNNRAFNFGACPAALPEAVLQQAQAELLNWHERGLSIMEMSHRGADFEGVAKQAEQDLRDLLAIPDQYKVLFLQGGASQQFAQIPLNLVSETQQVDYIDSGIWAKKAIAEASRFCNVNVAASGKDANYFALPKQREWQLSKDATYVHYTMNETIGGVEYSWIPDVGDTLLISDVSSTILSRPLDVSKFGLIYAGAQKNIGPSGLVVVIIREDLLGKARSTCPTMLDYKVAADNDSMYNTPPTFALYISGLIYKWVKQQGGLEAMEKVNKQKKDLLYGYIDSTDFYNNPVNAEDRSWMNVPFTLADERLDKAFLAEADQQGLLYLKGHRSVGGMRASIYNAVSLEAVETLVDFMKAFEKEHG